MNTHTHVRVRTHTHAHNTSVWEYGGKVLGRDGRRDDTDYQLKRPNYLSNSDYTSHQSSFKVLILNLPMAEFLEYRKVDSPLIFILVEVVNSSLRKTSQVEKSIRLENSYCWLVSSLRRSNVYSLPKVL